MSDYLSSLSKPQCEAVENYKGATLVIAGAGSGKTRVLTYRIAYMISKGVDPNTILALTFTKKAATEMRERVTAIVSREQSRGLWMGTFHSVFARILRMEADAIGFPNTFTIYETSDSRNVVKGIIKDLNLDDNKYKPKDVFSRISLAKNSLTTPAMYRDNTSLITEDRERGMARFNEVYTAYMHRCRQNGAMDFDDLLLYTNILFKEHPQILEKYQGVFQYILVDEYQDTNSAQYLIVKKLSAVHHNICAVGDDAQSIYSFRGARIENILRFQNDYKNARICKLEENYRSTQNIVNAANSVIKKNKGQLKKTVFSNKEVGEKILLSMAESDKEEARNVVRDIVKSHNNDVQYSDIAILYRTNAQSRAMEDALRLRNVPYRIYGGMSFYQRAEVKHVVAYVRLIVNKHDDEALKRIVNFPLRGIGATTISRVEHGAKERGVSMWQFMSVAKGEEIGLKDAPMRKLHSFMSLIEELRVLSQEVDAYELVFALCQKSAIIATYQNNPAPESQSAYENIEELVNAVKQQVDSVKKDSGSTLMVDKWVEDITLLSDMDRDESKEDTVTLMTIHSSKGLEFGSIYIVGMEDGLFPSTNSTSSLSDLEEERRLFYVAITRAINRLVMSFSLTRFKWGSLTNSRPSPFLNDVDECFYENPEMLNFTKTKFVEESEMPKSQYRSSVGDFKPKSSYESASKPENLKRMTSVTASKGAVVATYDKINVGTKVRHAKFGIGEVQSMESFGNDVKALILFEVAGSKSMLLKFARLEVVE